MRNGTSWLSFLIGFQVHSISPIPPALFFDLEVKIGRTLKKLPVTGHLLAEQTFADVSLAYFENGLEVEVALKRPFKDDDAVHLFVDTRDLKTSKTITRFCHHYKCTKEGGTELTRFRGDDTHSLLDHFSIECEDKIMRITLDQLTGFDPSRLNRMGFTYQIVREDGAPQHFTLTKDTHNLSQNPHLWTSITLELA